MKNKDLMEEFKYSCWLRNNQYDSRPLHKYFFLLINIMMNIISLINSNVAYLNGSKLFAGLVMITLNLCTRFINFKLGKTTETFIKSNLTKQLLVFSISWMGTRDIYTALILTAVFTIIFDLMFNEESSCCIIPEKYKILEDAIDTNKDGVISEEELNAALSTIEKANKQKQKKQQRSSLSSFQTYLA
tara:strand:+ start:1296 stop:1859 length:564 start_codon:yes stop_codon:yes gene_type:complete